jgi:hypothetical protein
LGPARARTGVYRLSLLTLAQCLASMDSLGRDLRARLQRMNFYESYVHISIRGLNAMRRGAKELATKWLPSPAGEVCIDAIGSL